MRRRLTLRCRLRLRSRLRLRCWLVQVAPALPRRLPGHTHDRGDLGPGLAVPAGHPDGRHLGLVEYPAQQAHVSERAQRAIARTPALLPVRETLQGPLALTPLAHAVRVA